MFPASNRAGISRLDRFQREPQTSCATWTTRASQRYLGNVDATNDKVQQQPAKPVQQQGVSPWKYAAIALSSCGSAAASTVLPAIPARKRFSNSSRITG